MAHGTELPPPMQAMQMMMGHWAAQILATVAELGVADRLAQGAQTSEAIAKAVDANPDALHRLLRAAAALGIVQQTAEHTFALAPIGDCLRSDSPTGLRDFIVAELAPGHWLPWGKLSRAVRAGKSQSQAALGMDVWTYYAKHPDEAAWFARGMGNLSKMVAQDVVAAYSFASFKRLCDVGGSQGALIAAILRGNPSVEGMIFDRPEVIAEAQPMVASYDLGSRLTAAGGDFFNHVPGDCDGYLLKSILHDWDDEHCVKILSVVHRAAPAGAKLLVFEMLLSDSPMSTPVKLMDLNMLVMLDGRERTAEQYGALMHKAGWKLDRVVPTHGLFAVLEASRV